MCCPYPCFRWGNRILERLSKLPQFPQFELVELEFEPRQLFLKFVSLTPCCPTSLMHKEDLALTIYTLICMISSLSLLSDARLVKRYFQCEVISTKREESTRDLGSKRSPNTSSFMPITSPYLLWLSESRFYHLSILQTQSENSESCGDLPKFTQQVYGTARIGAPVSWTLSRVHPPSQCPSGSVQVCDLLCCWTRYPGPAL